MKTCSVYIDGPFIPAFEAGVSVFDYALLGYTGHVIEAAEALMPGAALFVNSPDYNAMTYLKRWIHLLPILLLLGGCSTDHPVAPEPRAIFEVEVAGQETFRIALSDPAQITAAAQWLSSGHEGIVQGELARGDGGFNAPYSWHLKPETVTFPDQTVEVCSGRPRSDVEADLDYWIDTLGTYCPWGVRIVGRTADG